MKNTVLFVEPRDNDFCVNILHQYIRILGTDNWHYVFYTGKDCLDKWTSINPVVEIRELPVSNFNNLMEYSDFMKQKSLWESLVGDFVLTIQLDTWIFDNAGYDIYHFMNMNYSFIGGNMSYEWDEIKREGLSFSNCNFNGGLSLRKREHMIRVCDAFPPEPCVKISGKIETDLEDVYFVLGCVRLGLPVGCNEDTACFALHTIYKPSFFGVHKVTVDARYGLLHYYPELQNMHPYVYG